MTTWLVLGSGGMLAAEIEQRVQAQGQDLQQATIADVDITDAHGVTEYVSVWAKEKRVAGYQKLQIVNAAAYTAVDAAETNEPAAFAVNALGAGFAAAAAQAVAADFLHISTDYVFSGNATAPYAVDAYASPQSAYGRTKLAGEWAVRAACPAARIIRTSWLYGAHGPNFVSTMLRLVAEHETLQVVDDQVGSPTWAGHLAQQAVALVAIDSTRGQTFHGTNTGQTTWWGFAREIFRLQGWDVNRVQPTTTDHYPRPAARPAYSVLGQDAWHGTGLAPLPSWQTALSASLPAISAAFTSLPNSGNHGNTKQEN